MTAMHFSIITAIHLLKVDCVILGEAEGPAST